ncbi:Protein RTA1 [Lachnellula suecica]|uniref:Protein RTA1 n=1 Tax=Lachnellula suecica TaxID=602035 RepID=A0A8T9CN21_9HELO|nr:Protein RTA1 [Lachnellula suecica]
MAAPRSNKNLLAVPGVLTDICRYHPSMVAAVIFIILFIATTSVHVFQAAKGRTYYFIPLILGGFFEWIGYVGRALAHSNEHSLGIYILQTLLLLLAPALFAASIYMVLGRLVLLTNSESLAPIRSSRLTKIFVLGDVASFLVQSGGGAMMSNAKSQNSGKTIIIIGLFLQLIFFGVFVVTSAIFHKRLSASPTGESMRVPWKKYIFALYGASVLILIRCVFRVIEFLSGNTGYLAEHEIFLYLFDGVLMLGVMVGFNFVHPGAIIGRNAAKADGIILSDSESMGGLRLERN